MTGNGVVPCPWQNCPQGGPMRVANDSRKATGNRDTMAGPSACRPEQLAEYGLVPDPKGR
jgi:hypothetical protein